MFTSVIARRAELVAGRRGNLDRGAMRLLRPLKNVQGPRNDEAR